MRKGASAGARKAAPRFIEDFVAARALAPREFAASIEPKWKLFDARIRHVLLDRAHSSGVPLREAKVEALMSGLFAAPLLELQRADQIAHAVIAATEQELAEEAPEWDPKGAVDRYAGLGEYSRDGGYLRILEMARIYGEEEYATRNAKVRDDFDRIGEAFSRFSAAEAAFANHLYDLPNISDAERDAELGRRAGYSKVMRGRLRRRWAA